jgi:dolichol kinase
MEFLSSALLSASLLISLHLLLALKPKFLQDDRLQLRRKLQHITTGMLFYLLEPIFDRTQASILLWFGAGVVFLFHIVRLHYPNINQYFMEVCKAYLRPHERHALPGAFYFFVGVAIAVTMFPRRIALLALLYLSIGDPIASYFGVVYGAKSFRFSNGKSVVGMMAMMTLCFIMTLGFFAVRGGMMGMDWGIAEILSWAIIGAVSAAMAESLPILHIMGLDDNLKVPVISGSALWILQNMTKA